MNEEPRVLTGLTLESVRGAMEEAANAVEAAPAAEVEVEVEGTVEVAAAGAAEEVVEEAPPEKKPQVKRVPVTSPEYALFGASASAIRGAPYHIDLMSFDLDTNIFNALLYRKGRTASYSMVGSGDQLMVQIPSRIQPPRGIDLTAVLAKMSAAWVKNVAVDDLYLDFSNAEVSPGEELADAEVEMEEGEMARVFSYKVTGCALALVPAPPVEEVAEEEEEGKTAEEE